MFLDVASNVARISKVYFCLKEYTFVVLLLSRSPVDVWQADVLRIPKKSRATTTPNFVGAYIVCNVFYKVILGICVNET